jgi:hypothetical protein
MTGIAKGVGGHLDKDPFGNIVGTISGLEKVQTQFVVKRFESAGFSEFYSYNRKVHPGINLERPESNDNVWYHVTLEPGKIPSMTVPTPMNLATCWLAVLWEACQAPTRSSVIREELKMRLTPTAIPMPGHDLKPACLGGVAP